VSWDTDQRSRLYDGLCPSWLLHPTHRRCSEAAVVPIRLHSGLVGYMKSWRSSTWSNLPVIRGVQGVRRCRGRAQCDRDPGHGTLVRHGGPVGFSPGVVGNRTRRHCCNSTDRAFDGYANSIPHFSGSMIAVSTYRFSQHVLNGDRCSLFRLSLSLPKFSWCATCNRVNVVRPLLSIERCWHKDMGWLVIGEWQEPVIQVGRLEVSWRTRQTDDWTLKGLQWSGSSGCFGEAVHSDVDMQAADCSPVAYSTSGEWELPLKTTWTSRSDSEMNSVITQTQQPPTVHGHNNNIQDNTN